jgi:hypothetical protein
VLAWSALRWMLIYCTSGSSSNHLHHRLHQLTCATYRNEFDCTDLQTYFEHLDTAKTLPSFATLYEKAQLLAQRHASTGSHQLAQRPHAANLNSVPLGRPWVPSAEAQPTKAEPQASTSKQSKRTNDSSAVEEEVLSELSADEDSTLLERPDITLANAILFVRNAIWWTEYCSAVAMGDTGRVYEILKVSSELMFRA